MARVRALPERPVAPMLGGGPLLVVAPHPDDESIGAAGLIMAALDAGLPVGIAVVTDGSASHPGMDRAALAAVRRTETLAAASVLGVAPGDVTFLDATDGAAPHRGQAARHYGERLGALAADMGAATVVTSWDFDPHPDHVAACAYAARAARGRGTALFAYPVWSWTLPPRTVLPARPLAGFAVPLATRHGRKREALMCHASQTRGLGGTEGDGWEDGFTLSTDHMAAMDMRTERFVAMNAAARARLRP